MNHDYKLITIGDRTISSPVELKEVFAIRDVWDRVDNDRLREWEEFSKDSIAADIRNAIDNRRSGKAPEFLTDGKMGWPMIFAHFLDGDDKDVLYTDHQHEIVPILEAMEKLDCLSAPLTPVQAWDAYLFALLHIQFFQRSISEESESFLRLHLKEISLSLHISKISVCDKDVRIPQGKEILRWNAESGNSSVETTGADSEILGCAYTGNEKHIAFTKDGLLPETSSRVANMVVGGTVTAVSAYGGFYALLTGDRRVVTNLVFANVRAWTDVRAVNVGLNSIAAIRGNSRQPVQAGLDKGTADLFDRYAKAGKAASVHTRASDRFAILCQSGELYLDSGKRDGRYTAATLGQGYYAFSDETHLFLLKFDDKLTKIPLLYGFIPAEIHVRDSFVVCGGYVGEEFRVYAAKTTDPKPKLMRIFCGESDSLDGLGERR